MDTGAIDTVYCPTEDMLADFFTKPLQGSLLRELFRKFRDIVMGNKYVRYPKKAIIEFRPGACWKS